MEPTDQQIIDYLLGDIVSDSEQQRIEENLFSGDDFFERLQVIENRLIDLYLLDKLSKAERTTFEDEYLISSRRREAITNSSEFIHLLDSYRFRKQPKPKKGWQWLLSLFEAHNIALQFSLASLLLIVSSGFIWLLVEMARLKAQNAATEAALHRKEENFQQQASNREQIAAERAALEREREELNRNEASLRRREEDLRALEARANDGAKGRSPIATFVLSLNVRSGADSPELVIRRNDKFVRLIAYLEGGLAERYRASLQNINDEEVWSAIVPKPRTTLNRLTFLVPASKFTQRDYFVKIEGIRSDGQAISRFEYSLVVRKEKISK
jgi:hypothetical protein